MTSTAHTKFSSSLYSFTLSLCRNKMYSLRCTLDVKAIHGKGFCFINNTDLRALKTSKGERVFYLMCSTFVLPPTKKFSLSESSVCVAYLLDHNLWLRLFQSSSSHLCLCSPRRRIWDSLWVWVLCSIIFHAVTTMAVLRQTHRLSFHWTIYPEDTEVQTRLSSHYVETVADTVKG